MPLTRNGRIVSATVLFSKTGEPDYNSLGMSEIADKDECPFRFDINEVSNYNESDNPNSMTLRLKNGDAFNLAHTFEEFDEFMKLNIND